MMINYKIKNIKSRIPRYTRELITVEHGYRAGSSIDSLSMVLNLFMYNTISLREWYVVMWYIYRAISPSVIRCCSAAAGMHIRHFF